MNCSKCGFKNEEQANFCKQCGSPLNIIENSSNDSTSINQNILLGIIILFSSFTTIFWFIYTRILDDWWEYKYIAFAINILSVLVPLVISFFIKDKVMKIICVVFSLIALGLSLYSNISNF